MTAVALCEDTTIGWKEITYSSPLTLNKTYEAGISLWEKGDLFLRVLYIEFKHLSKMVSIMVLYTQLLL